jgi:hypothetical protein
LQLTFVGTIQGIAQASRQVLIGGRDLHGLPLVDVDDALQGTLLLFEFLGVAYEIEDLSSVCACKPTRNGEQPTFVAIPNTLTCGAFHQDCIIVFTARPGKVAFPEVDPAVLTSGGVLLVVFRKIGIVLVLLNQFVSSIQSGPF